MLDKKPMVGATVTLRALEHSARPRVAEAKVDSRGEFVVRGITTLGLRRVLVRYKGVTYDPNAGSFEPGLHVGPGSHLSLWFESDAEYARRHRWEKMPNVPFSDCTGLAYAPTAPDTIYAVGDENLFVSADRGRTWKQLPQYSGDDILSPVVKPDNPTRLYTWDGASTLWSDDGGNTWTAVPLPGRSARVMACTAGSPGYLYLASPFGGFWRSDIQGGNAQEITDLGGRVERVATSCQNPNELYAVVVLGDVFSTNTKLIHSPDAGLTWAQAGKGVLQGKLVEIALAATDGGIVDVLTETGQLGPSAKALYYRSRDRGKTWSKPVAVGEFAGPISIDVRDPNRIVTFSDFVTPRLSTDGGRTWQSIANPKANITEPTAVAALGDGVVLGALGADGPHELCRLANPARER